MEYDPSYRYGARLTISFPDNTVGKCPSCGRDVIDNGKGYSCTGYRAGCPFVIWKVQFRGTPDETRITPAMAKKILIKQNQLKHEAEQRNKGK